MNVIIRAFTCAALASCLSSQPLRAGEAASGTLVVSQAWSRATPGGAKVAGGYVTIENRGTAPDGCCPARPSWRSDWKYTRWP